MVMPELVVTLIDAKGFRELRFQSFNFIQWSKDEGQVLSSLPHNGVAMRTKYDTSHRTTLQRQKDDLS